MLPKPPVLPVVGYIGGRPGKLKRALWISRIGVAREREGRLAEAQSRAIIPGGVPVIHRDGRFQIGQVVRHRLYPFRGVVFDVDPTFSNTEEWWLSIPNDVRPTKDQPYYHLLAENEQTTYIAYVSEQNLLPDSDGGPVRHPLVLEFFGELRDGFYDLRSHQPH